MNNIIKSIEKNRELDEINLTLTSSVVQKGKIVVGALVVFSGLCVIPGVLAGFLSMLSSFVIGSLVLGTVTIGYFLSKNKDIKRGLKYQFKNQSKKIAEKLLRIEPLEFAELILAERNKELQNIALNIQDLSGQLAVIKDEKKINEKLIEEKSIMLQKAQAENNKTIIDIYAVEIVELQDTNILLEENEMQLEFTLINLSGVEEASKYKLDRSNAQFEQLKIRKNIVDKTHKALKSANIILNGEHENKDLDKSLSDFRKEMVLKINEISTFGKSSSSFVEKTKFEKEAKTQIALKMIESKKLQQNNSLEIKQSES